jgi:hypothetical protein
MRSTPLLPLPLRPVQHLLVRAAIDLTPCWLPAILRLNAHELHTWEAEIVRQAGAFVDRLVLESNPADRLVGACGFQQIICIPGNKRCINDRGQGAAEPRAN